MRGSHWFYWCFGCWSRALKLGRYGHLSRGQKEDKSWLLPKQQAVVFTSREIKLMGVLDTSGKGNTWNSLVCWLYKVSSAACLQIIPR